MYLQVLEELGARWAAVAVATSVHGLSCFPLATAGTDEQKAEWLPGLLAGEQIGAYSLSEPQAGSDAAALRCRAVREGDGPDAAYVVTGTKSWITHGGIADVYNTFLRTGEGSRGISCLLVPRDTENLHFGKPEDKMGLNGVPTTTASYEGARVDADRLIGAEGDGLRIAFSALDSGRLGIAAVATGIAQRALDDAVAYANERETFGKTIIGHQGLGFLLADMAAAVAPPAPPTWTPPAARTPAARTAGGVDRQLTATDAAMKVTTDAVQVLGGVGYTREFPAERYMREAKITQIFEGTNQIQRLVIARGLSTEPCAYGGPHGPAL